MCHSSSQITALPFYTDFLINKVSTLGLSISYKKVDEIQPAITDEVCREYQKKGLVVLLDYLTLCSLLQLLIMLITTSVLVLLKTIFTGQVFNCFNILIHQHQTIKSCLICQVKHWVDRGTLNSHRITQKLHPLEQSKVTVRERQ